MNQAAIGPAAREVASLSRRDWILLPVIGLLAFVSLFGLTELIAQAAFAPSRTGYERCLVLDDPRTGARGIPNSVCREKAPETGWIEYRFNSCGHRAGMECGPRRPGYYRIVMMGSSVALGQHVQREQSFAALLPVALTQLAGRPVELYNEGMGFGFTHSAALRFQEVLDAQPDLILWALTPVDIVRSGNVLPQGPTDPGAGRSFLKRNWSRVQAAIASSGIKGAAAELFGYSKSSYMLQHFLYASQTETVAAFLRAPDSQAGYLKSQQSPLWASAFQQFEKDAAELQGRARTAGIPFAAVLIPGRAQSAMISAGEWPSGYDPDKLNEQLRSVVERNGGVYVDILPDFRHFPHPERLYLPMDGHPNIEGSSVIASMLARGLAGGAIAVLRSNPGQQALKGPSE